MAYNSFRRTRSVLALLLALVLWAAFPARAGAIGAAVELPSLAEFVEEVSNGDTDSLRGIYVPDLMAGAIIPQPEGDRGFVSSEEDTLTQFRLAEEYGSTGLLAHNTLAGGYFSELEEGRVIILVYGGGRTESYIVTETLRFRALDPENTRSLFLDLDRGGLLTTPQVFLDVYDRPGDVILQTCIEAGGDPSWGRLFVIAEPYSTNP